MSGPPIEATAGLIFSGIATEAGTVSGTCDGVQITVDVARGDTAADVAAAVAAAINTQRAARLRPKASS